MNYIQLLRSYPRQITYGILHYFFSSFGQTFLLGLFALHFAEAVAINNVQFSWIYSGATLSSAFILPILGKYLDVVKLRYFSLVVGLGLAVFSFSAGSLNHVIWLAITIFGLRLCGQGLMTLTASTAIARYFEETRGKALSLIGFGVSIGEFIFPILITLLMSAIGWRMSWYFIAIFILVAFIPSIIGLISINNDFQLPEAQQSAQNTHTASGATRQEVLRDPKFWLLMLVYLWVPFFTTGAMIHQGILAEANGWSIALMASAISTHGLVRMMANLFFGPAIDRFSARKTFGFMLFPMILGCILMMLSQAPWVAVVFFMLVGLGTSLFSLTGTALWAEVYGTAHFGAIRSMVSTFMVVSSAIAPVVFGWAFSKESWFMTSWATMAVLMGLCTAVGFMVIRKMVPITSD